MRQVVESILDQQETNRVELIDLNTLYPIDWRTLLQSVKRTGKLLIVEPDVQYGGIGAEIAATVAESHPGVVVRRLGGPRETIPASREGQARMLPSRDQILEAIRGLV